MPNIKSAKKRVKIIETKSAQNSMIRTGYKTAVKKFETAVEKNENVDESFKDAVKAIDKACAKGIIKKNSASRKKSTLSKKLIAVK